MANQMLAARARRVYWMMAGIAVDIKALQQAQAAG
jgi:adenosyl cobinamide kinase/adenosyl cobinamide phosphate guanylyltransferase